MQYRLFIAAVAAAILYVPFTTAIADDREQAALATVIVSGLRVPSDIATAATIVVIGREEIERSGARTVAEVLRGRAGIQVRDLYGTGSRTGISLRGFGDNAAANTLILVDGRRLNNSDLAAPDLGTISLAEVERIEIVAGGAGVLFGDQAVGGVVNIITRRAEPGTRGGVTLLAGSHGLREVRAALSLGGGDGTALRLGALKREADHYRDNNEEDTRILDARLDGRLGAVDLFAEVHSAREDLRLPGGLFQTDLAADRRQTRHPDDFADTGTDVWRAGVATDIGADWRFEADVARRTGDGAGVLTGTAWTQERDYRSAHPRFSGPLFGGVVTVGMDFERNDYDFTAFGRTAALQQLEGAYALAVLPVGEGLEATLGARRDIVSHRVTDDFGCPGGERFADDANAWEAGIAWRPVAGARYYLRAADVFRFPKVDELTYTANGGCGRLDAQTGRSYELGAEWRRDGGNLRTMLWRLELEDEIDFDPAANFGFGANVNLDPTRRDGLLVEAGFAATAALRLSAHYAWTDARFRNGGFVGNDIPLVPRHQARLAADYALADAWSVFGEAHYSGASSASGDYANALARLPAHTVANVGLGWAKGAWRVQMRIDNLFDRKSSDYAAKGFNPWPAEETAFYPAPGRTFRLSLTGVF